MCDVNTQIK